MRRWLDNETAVANTFCHASRNDTSIYIHNAHIDTHTYIHTYIHTFIHTCMHTYMHTYHNSDVDYEGAVRAPPVRVHVPW